MFMPRTPELFDEEVPVSDSASPTERFVAFLGRDPGFAPVERPALSAAPSAAPASNPARSARCPPCRFLRGAHDALASYGRPEAFHLVPAVHRLPEPCARHVRGADVDLRSLREELPSGRHSRDREAASRAAGAVCRPRRRMGVPGGLRATSTGTPSVQRSNSRSLTTRAAPSFSSSAAAITPDRISRRYPPSTRNVRPFFRRTRNGAAPSLPIASCSSQLPAVAARRAPAADVPNVADPVVASRSPSCPEDELHPRRLRRPVVPAAVGSSRPSRGRVAGVALRSRSYQDLLLVVRGLLRARSATPDPGTGPRTGAPCHRSTARSRRSHIGSRARSPLGSDRGSRPALEWP